MSKVSVIGSFTCKQGMADEVEAVLTKMVDASRSEDGVEIYSYHRGDNDTYWFFALMSSAESMQGHGQSDAMKLAMADFMPLVASPPQMSVTTPIAATGLDL